MNPSRAGNQAGFTLIETVMAMATVGVVGLAIFYTLFSGLLLFTKNTAMNVSHEEARVALIQLEQDLHSAVSLPELTDSNANMIAGQGPAAGVEFQVLVQPSQYCQVTANASTGQAHVLVGIPSGYPTPYAGMRLIIPSYQIEEDVSAVSMSGTVANCTLSSNIPTAINTSDTFGSYNIVCFFTQRVYYYVTGATTSYSNSLSLALNYIGVNKTQSYVMAANDVSSATPFSIPSTTSGAPNYRYVVAVNLSAEDPNTSALATRFRFNTSSIMLSGQIPSYVTLTTYQ
jgi:type II secretory pathway pseudopilin PulG